MVPVIQFKERKTPMLEKFGTYYLNLFRKRDLTHHVFDYSDEELSAKVRAISTHGMLLSALIGLFLVWPTVYIDVLKQDQPWYIHYGWVVAVTGISIAIEFYLLFLIALKTVHRVSELINMNAQSRDFLKDGPFSITNILARTALELHDPELSILGIDPFERISKKNLFLLGLLYKLKITLTNFVGKFLLIHFIGRAIAGISINYIALPVECFWNAVVILRVVREARLRLFGFALCIHIGENVFHDHLLEKLSPEAKKGCLRAIGNAIVLGRNYHPNMILLLLRFQHLLHIFKDDRYDDWDLYLRTLGSVTPQERNFLMDLFTIAAAFDGKISRMESEHIREAYGEFYELYLPRLLQLTHHLKTGRLHAAADLCKIDFVAG